MIKIYGNVFPKPDRNMHRIAEHRAALGMLAKGLQEIYGLEYGQDNLQKQIQVKEGGKPFLKDHPEISFNISHSGEIAVCAFSDRDIGVDIEKIVPVRESLVNRVLHEKEKRVLQGLTADRIDNNSDITARDLLFFRYWTLKEGYLKMTGTGLRTEPRELLFFVNPANWDRPVFAQDEDLFCFQKMIENTYVLSLCTDSGTASGKGKEYVSMELFKKDEFDTIII